MDTHGTKELQKATFNIRDVSLRSGGGPGSSGFPEFNCKMSHCARPSQLKAGSSPHHSTADGRTEQHKLGSARHPIKFTHSGRNIIVPMIENYSKPNKQKSVANIHCPTVLSFFLAFVINKEKRCNRNEVAFL